MKTTAILAALLAATAGTAHAQACAFSGDTVQPDIDSFNQMMLDDRYDDFTAAMQASMGTDLTETMAQLVQIYPGGFSACTTIAQRSDVGGMVQELVIFDSANGPLFIYWAYVAGPDGFRLLAYSIDSDSDAIDKLH